MRTVNVWFAIAAVLALTAAGIAAAEPKRFWLDYSAGHREWTNGKPMVVFITADWCPKCPEFKRQAEKMFGKYDVAPVLLKDDDPIARQIVTDSPMPVIAVFGVRDTQLVVGYQESVIEAHIKQALTEVDK